MKLTRLYEEDEGVDFEKLQQSWLASGRPDKPQELVDFLKSNLSLTPDQINTVFKKGAGLTLLGADEKDRKESLTPDSVKNIQTFLGNLNPKELQELADQVQAVKVMGKNELKRQQAGEYHAAAQ